MHRSRGIVAAMMVALVAMWGCSADITEQDLDKWTNNDRGFQRIKELLQSKEVALDIKVRALEVVVTKGFGNRLHNLLTALKDDRPQIVKGLIRQMQKQLVSEDSANQRDAKDALLLLSRQASKEELARIHEKLSDWAFKGVTWETPRKEVRDKINDRISAGQIAELGPYAYEIAAILVARSFSVKQMLELLASSKDKRRAADLTLKGLKLLHKEWGVQDHHIVALSKLPSEGTARYLHEIYFHVNEKGERLEDDIRIPAFNALRAMLCPTACGDDRKARRKEAACEACCRKNKGVVDEFDGSSCSCKWDGISADYSPCRPHAAITRARDKIAKMLFKSMSTAEAEDPWLFAIWTLRLLGTDSVDEVFKRLKDTKGNYSGEIDTYITNFCNYVNDEGFGRIAAPVFASHLNDPNRLVRAVSMICLKVVGAQAYKTKLSAVASKLLVKRDVVIEDILGGEGMTVGKLATNAVDGLNLLVSLDANLKPKIKALETKMAQLPKVRHPDSVEAIKYGKLRDALKKVQVEYNRRSDLIREWHDKTGDAYKLFIDSEIAADKKAEAEKKAADAKARAALTKSRAPKAAPSKSPAKAPAAASDKKAAAPSSTDKK